MRRSVLRLISVALALVVLGCAADEAGDEFNAGGGERYALTSITTYTDGEVAERPGEAGAGEYVLDGTLVFHLVRLESGDFIALSARDPYSDCWVPWQPEVELEGRMGWFRDPCRGSTYDEQGVRVAGPSTRDLDRYPVEVRGGEVYVNLADDAIVAGQARVAAVGASPSNESATPASASPTRPPESATPPPPPPPPSPTARPVLTTATPEPVETVAPMATPTPTPTPIGIPPTSLPRPIDGAPYGGAALVAALAAAGVEYGPQNETRTCTGAGTRGVVYGSEGYGGNASWPEFTLWVYPSSQALQADWELPSSGPPRSRLDNCPLAGTFVFWNANLLIDFGSRDRWEGHSALREQIREVFLSLGATTALPAGSDVSLRRPPD